MAYYLVIFSIIILVCFFLNKASIRLGIPVLLFFLVLGIMYGARYDDFVDLYGKEVETICTICLIFIMFYGGFGTRWSSAKPVATEAGLLATLGVAMTAGFVGAFCHYALNWAWTESFLMGAVISSTDAASVFSILRTKRLGLKNNAAPLIEIESGSNDPMSYMLTAVMLSVLKGTATGEQVVWTIFSQLFFGTICGLAIATGTIFMFKRIPLKSTGFDTLVIFSIALISYAIPSIIGGNGYLSSYITGIVLGNTAFPGRKVLMNFFDGITSLCQISIFFLLGMLTIPAKLAGAIIPAILIFIFMTFVARPLAVGTLLLPFRRKFNEIGLISFVGLRGAASIVFAIMILTEGKGLQNDIFSITFCIVLISIAIQGSFIPLAAEKFRMVDKDADVMTTFSDFSENAGVSFGRIVISKKNNWKGLMVKDLNLPQGCLITIILRDGKHVVPEGSTTIMDGDEVILCTRSYENVSGDNLTEHIVAKGNLWIGKKLKDCHMSKDTLLVMIRRENREIIPNGENSIKEGDILYLLNLSRNENRIS